jgi:MFS family permease
MDSVEETPLQGADRSPIRVPLAASADFRSHRKFAMVVLLIGAFLPPLDFFIVNLALAAIQEGFRTTGGQLQLVISCYASAYAVFLITGGRLGDRRRPLEVAGRKTNRKGEEHS